MNNKQESEVPQVPEELENVSEEEIKQFDAHLNSISSDKSTNAARVGLRTIEEIEADLSKPIPKQYIKVLDKGPAKGSKYVSWIIVQRALSRFAPGWSTRSTGFSTPVGAAIIVELSIPTATGTVTRAGHGFEPHETTNFKGEVKATGFGGAPVVASAQAFKRSAVAYGFGRDLYPV